MAFGAGSAGLAGFASRLLALVVFLIVGWSLVSARAELVAAQNIANIAEAAMHETMRMLPPASPE